MAKQIRLQKFLADLGIGSRRQLESLIEQQQITVNGKIAILGCKVFGRENITISGKKINLPESRDEMVRILLYHKPLGEICSKKDPEGRINVFENLPKLTKERWISIGRLDINTSGLLLFTNNGSIAHELMHPSSRILRKYAVRIFGVPTPEMLQTLQTGVILDDGMAKFESLQEAGGDHKNKWFHVSLYEGRNREVRRLWQSQGLQVSRIIRFQFGTISLPRNLRAGHYVELRASEIKNLLQNIKKKQ